MVTQMAAQNPSPERRAAAETVFLILDRGLPLAPGFKELMGLLAKLSKADGAVSAEEITATDEFLRFGLDLPDRMREQAIACFRNAKADNKTYKFYIDKCAELMPREILEEFAFELLLEVALPDGELHEAEAEILEYAAIVFGVEEAFDSEHYRDSAEDDYEDDGAAFNGSGSGRGEEPVGRSLVRVGMVGQPVEQSAGEPFGAEGVGPFVERQVRRDDDGWGEGALRQSVQSSTAISLAVAADHSGVRTGAG